MSYTNSSTAQKLKSGDFAIYITNQKEIEKLIERKAGYK